MPGHFIAQLKTFVKENSFFVYHLLEAEINTNFLFIHYITVYKSEQKIKGITHFETFRLLITNHNFFQGLKGSTVPIFSLRQI